MAVRKASDLQCWLLTSIELLFRAADLSAMPSCERLLWRVPRIFQRRVSAVAGVKYQRCSTSRNSPLCTFLEYKASTISHGRHRAFTSSAKQRITGQETPSAQAYISSGVLGTNRNLVDVKKVIVIGSGGLSIGQAGEFDYSG